MKIVKIDCQKIVDWETFHDVFTDAMGFPGFYGRNMDAWIDCMRSVDRPEDGLSKIQVEKGKILTLQLDNVDEFRKKYPKLYAEIIECSGLINGSRIKQGNDSILALSFFMN